MILFIFRTSRPDEIKIIVNGLYYLSEDTILLSVDTSKAPEKIS